MNPPIEIRAVVRRIYPRQKLRRGFAGLAAVLCLSGQLAWSQQPAPPAAPLPSGGSQADHIPASENILLPGPFEPAPPPAPDPFAPGLGTNFSSLTFDEDAANTGFYHIPPDPMGAAGSNHVVAVVNSSIRWHTKAGVQQYNNRLGKNSSTSTGSFFAPLSPVNGTFDPKVIYDQHAGRFVVVTLERQDTASGAPTNTSRILLAVSDDNDPNGTWYYTAINSKITIGSDAWADYPGFAVDEEAIYVTANMFSFGASGTYLGTRLWIIKKTEFYTNGVAVVTVHDPFASVGLGNAGTLQPAQVYGAGVGTTNGTFLVNGGWTSGASDLLAVIRVDSPLASPTFNNQFIDAGDIDNTGAAYPNAPQLGSANLINTGDRRVQRAVWRNNKLYTVNTVVPPSGADAGQVTAHWFVISTTNVASLTLLDQGNVGGEDIAANTHTFYPNIAVDAGDNIGIGFAASGTNIYPGAYYTGRQTTNSAGTLQPSGALKVGDDYYYRAFGGSRNRWGDYSGIAIDPSDDLTFWLFNEYAMTRGTVLGSFPTEDGRWATQWGSFRFNTAPNAVTDIVSRGKFTSLKINIASLLTNDIDAELDPITLVGINLLTTNNVTLFTNATTIFYTNSPNVDDKFTYTISDGHGGTNTGAVLIQIVQSSSTATTVRLQTGVPGANTNTITLAGIPGYQYVVQFSTNLVSGQWFNLSTNTAAANGLWTVIDGTATNAQRFYRTVVP